MRLMRVKQGFLGFIKEGSKTLEVRVGYSSIKRIQPGERIRMASRSDEQVVRVRHVRWYDSFDETLGMEDYRRIAPHISSDGELLRLLKKIYPPSKQKLGVVVLDIEPER